MRILRWDDGTKWDDPNAYWGSPSYVLEPGDPGYQPPPDDPSETPSNKPKKHTIMSSNATPTNRIILVALATKIKAGQTAIGGAVGLHHHLAPQMDLRLKKLIGDPAEPPGTPANKGSQSLYRECLTATDDAVEALSLLSDGAVKEWLYGYQKVLQSIHGKAASSDWVAAGFPQGTTSVPRSHDARQVLLLAARAYLASHAGYETSMPRKNQPPLEITAAAALALSGQMETAQALIASRKTEQAACKQVRDADVDALYDEVSATIAEIDDRLADDDPRWEAFGLNIPANPTPPEGVASLVMTSAGAGRELLEWPYATRVEYFRIFMKREGIDPDYVNVADARDLSYTLRNLTPGETISVYIEPNNVAGAGPASPVVTKVLGT
ncbi:MAG: fibronectin type III domain-containing protein [Verrucomicrobiales bacterium]|nr:fibronectin type III domain-containing protein [Verrucomicrobiales bacterium]